MTIFERLHTFFRHKDLTFNKVSEMTGISPGLLSKGLKKPDASLGSEKIIKLLEYFPDLSAEWLLREEGRMLKDDNSQVTNTVDEDCPLCNEKDKLVESYKDQIEQLIMDKNWLKEQFETKLNK
jgi:hypothetical protein